MTNDTFQTPSFIDDFDWDSRAITKIADAARDAIAELLESVIDQHAPIHADDEEMDAYLDEREAKFCMMVAQNLIGREIAPREVI